MKHFSFLFLLVMSLCLRAQNPLFIESVGVDTMLNDFFNNGCIEISNITSAGDTTSIGYFQAVGTEVPVSAGLVLSTGKISDLPNPSGFFAATSLGLPGFEDPNPIPGYTSYDAVYIEFDLKSCLSDLSFMYAFGSEEYPEFSFSNFNDFFKFFVQGPNDTMAINIALLPNTAIPVSINNVNQQDNNLYYVDNTNGTFCAFDGMTTLLPAAMSLDTSATYHITIVVSDVSDSVFDSGIFIGTQSIGGDSLVVPPTGFEANVVKSAMSVELLNTSRYATSYLWDFGDGQTSTEKNPGTYTYAQEGTYTITLTATNFCCSNTSTQTVSFGISNTNDRTDGFGIKPNPATQEALLYLPVLDGRLRVFNAMGQEILTTRAQVKTLLDVRTWAEGLYFVRFEASSKVYQQQLLVRH
jgi:hypothetical protein